jgi:hypothetical protein
LHPSIKLLARASGTADVTLETAERQRVCFSVMGGVLQVQPSTWHPEFGRSEPNLCLVVTFGEAVLRTRISW